MKFKILKYFFPHDYLFGLGFFYYLLTPFIILNYDLFNNYNQFDIFFKGYDFKNNYFYLSLIIIYFFSFILGSHWIHSFVKKTKIKSQINDYNYFEIVIVVIAILLNALIIINFNKLFVGYSSDNYNENNLRGTFTTLQMVLTFIFLYFKFQNNKFTFFTLLLIIENSIIIAGLGSRLYILFTLISYLIYLYFINKLKLKTFIFYALLTLTILFFVGAYRSNLELDFSLLAFFVLAEANFSWLSVSSMLELNSDFSLFSFPSNFFSSFLNFIPSFIYPEKAELIIDSKELLNFETPIGATNIFVSVISNFGILGACLFFFGIGTFFSIIYFKRKSLFLKVYYITICSILPFQFFRDSFSIINKSIFYNLLILPILFILFNKLIFLIVKTSEKKNIN